MGCAFRLSASDSTRFLMTAFRRFLCLNMILLFQDGLIDSFNRLNIRECTEIKNQEKSWEFRIDFEIIHWSKIFQQLRFWEWLRPHVTNKRIYYCIKYDTSGQLLVYFRFMNIPFISLFLDWNSAWVMWHDKWDSIIFGKILHCGTRLLKLIKQTSWT